MPPSGFSKSVVKGALQFVEGCYNDLLQEVREGKHQNYEEAIEFEVAQIKKALQSIHIDADGQLTDKETGLPLNLK